MQEEGRICMLPYTGSWQRELRKLQCKMFLLQCEKRQQPNFSWSTMQRWRPIVSSQQIAAAQQKKQAEQAAEEQAAAVDKRMEPYEGTDGSAGEERKAEEEVLNEEAAKAAERARQELEREGVVCTDEWEKLELRCALSYQRLTDPAKGSGCAHRACCNYQVLRNYVGRLANGPKHCPLATCGVRLQRTRDVVRDAALQVLLVDVPRNAVAVWLRGAENDAHLCPIAGGREECKRNAGLIARGSK